jgi:hypothetical protein
MFLKLFPWLKNTQAAPLVPNCYLKKMQILENCGPVKVFCL